jgi:hypothetical protein
LRYTAARSLTLDGWLCARKQRRVTAHMQQAYHARLAPLEHFA